MGWMYLAIEYLERFDKLGAISLNLSIFEALNQNEHFEVDSAQSQISEVSNMYQEIYQQKEPRKNITLKICHPIAIWVSRLSTCIPRKKCGKSLLSTGCRWKPQKKPLGPERNTWNVQTQRILRTKKTKEEVIDTNRQKSIFWRSFATSSVNFCQVVGLINCCLICWSTYWV